MAPEIIRMDQRNPYTFQSDVYAYGVVLYELTSNELPYKEIQHKEQIIFRVGSGILKPDASLIRKDIPKSLTKLYDECLNFKVDDRPLFKKVCI